MAEGEEYSVLTCLHTARVCGVVSRGISRLSSSNRNFIAATRCDCAREVRKWERPLLFRSSRPQPPLGRWYADGRERQRLSLIYGVNRLTVGALFVDGAID